MTEAILAPPIRSLDRVGVAALFAVDKRSSRAPKQSFHPRFQTWRTGGQQTRKGLEGLLTELGGVMFGRFGRCCMASHTLDAQGGRRILVYAGPAPPVGRSLMVGPSLNEEMLFPRGSDRFPQS